VNREAYLTDTLSRIAAGHPINRISELMPWAYQSPIAETRESPHSSLCLLMEARDLRAKLVRGRTQRIVGKMSVALGRHYRSMPEQSSHDLKAEAARNEMGCVGVYAGLPHNLGPEFFDFTQRLAGLVSGKEEWGVDQGVSSAIRRLGQLLTSSVSTSVRYAFGLTPWSLQVSISEASIAQFSALSSLPANRAFFLLRAIERIARSTVLESISIRLSSRKRIGPSQRLRA
jgi:hypothetical protein